jgi:urease accessory protein
VDAQPHIDTFAANRAVGRIALAVAHEAGASRRARVAEHGALRVRFPHGEDGALDAVIVNTAGGMTGGDRFAVDVALAAGARLTVTTAAAEKIYRALGPPAEIALRLDVGEGGALAWLPQETILFDRVRLRRTVDVALAPGARLLLAEAIMFGRVAMGEAVAQGEVFDRWRVRRAGRLLFAETIRLDGAVAQRLDEAAAGNGAVAIAAVLKAPGEETDVAAVRALPLAGEVGASAWNGIALVRLCAREGAALRRDLARVLGVLHGRALPRLWLN